MSRPMAPGRGDYVLRVRDQAGAADLLKSSAPGRARDCCDRTLRSICAPSPPYKPQEIKKLLAPHGWIPEVRVKPFRAQYDALPINDRYDIWKPFALGNKRIGVAIEMELWNVWTDLLKFRRGLHRGQIHVGVVLQDNVEHMTYVYEHLRLLSEPLFGKLPVRGVLPHPRVPA